MSLNTEALSASPEVAAMITKEKAQARLTVSECDDEFCFECSVLRTVIALHERVERLTEALKLLEGASQEMLTAIQEGGGFDSLMADIFPEQQRRGVTRRDEFKRLDTARNNLRAWMSNARAILKETTHD